MVFNISLATSPNSINQLFEAYALSRSYQYYMTELYNLWYFTSTVNDNTVTCVTYYHYYQFDGDYNGYYCDTMNYDTLTGLYTYVSVIGPATSTSNQLPQSTLEQLTLYYPLPTNYYVHDTTNNSFVDLNTLFTQYSGGTYASASGFKVNNYGGSGIKDLSEIFQPYTSGITAPLTGYVVNNGIYPANTDLAKIFQYVYGGGGNYPYVPINMPIVIIPINGGGGGYYGGGGVYYGGGGGGGGGGYYDWYYDDADDGGNEGSGDY
jgi:hypothetical protein